MLKARMSNTMISCIIATITLRLTAYAIPLTPPVSLPDTPTAWPFVYHQTSTQTALLTNGVTQSSTHFDTLAGPLQAHVMSINLANPNVRMGAVLAQNQVYSSDETVSSMANRTGAVGGINGDFFELGVSGRPENLCVVNGIVLQSQLPGGYAAVGITSDRHVRIGPETFAGQATVTSATYGNPANPSTSLETVTRATYGPKPPLQCPLVAVNRPGQEKGGRLVLITPAMGSEIYVPSDTVAYLTPTDTARKSYVVTAIKTGVKAIPALVNQVALDAGSGAAATWLQHACAVGDTLQITAGITPDSNIVQAVGAGYQILKDGAWYQDPHALGAFAVNQQNPLTAIGVTRDGQHAFLVVFDGRSAQSVSMGITYPQMAAYLLHIGAWNAAMLDGGGSSEMVARMPGTTHVSVVSTPSDGRERAVADGLFVYSTEATAQRAARVSLNGGAPLLLMLGATTSIPSFAMDAAGNLASGSLSLSVQPNALATVAGKTITAVRSGTGQLLATAANGVQASVPIRVVKSPATLTVTPADASLPPGQTQHLTVNATTADGQTIVLPKNATRWSSSNPALASVSAGGVLTTAATSPSLRFPLPSAVRVQAQIGTASSTVPLVVGYTPMALDSLTHPENWLISAKAEGTLAVSRWQRALKGDTGSLKVSYHYTAGPGSKQVVFWPKSTLTLKSSVNGDAPAGLGLWIRGNNSNVMFAVDLSGANGNHVTLYPATINFQGWRYVTVPFPSNLGAAVTLNFLDFLVVNPAKDSAGTLFASDLQALYPPNNFRLDPVSPAPDWLQMVPSPAAFPSGGTTTIVGGGALLNTASPTNVGATALRRMIDDIAAEFLSANGAQVSVQTVGDMVASSQPANDQAVRSALDKLGVVARYAVGTQEVNGQPETEGYRQFFGPTHYSYRAGAAEWIVLDDAHGGITASDSTQFPWLLQTLAKSSAKVVIIAANRSPYSGIRGNLSTVIDSRDAVALEQLVSDFQRTHPTTHVLLLCNGPQASLRQINATGQDVTFGGVVNLNVPPLTTLGGKSGQYMLLHVSDAGVVQWVNLPLVQAVGSRSDASGHSASG